MVEGFMSGFTLCAHPANFFLDLTRMACKSVDTEATHYKPLLNIVLAFSQMVWQPGTVTEKLRSDMCLAKRFKQQYKHMLKGSNL